MHAAVDAGPGAAVLAHALRHAVQCGGGSLGVRTLAGAPLVDGQVS